MKTRNISILIFLITILIFNYENSKSKENKVIFKPIITIITPNEIENSNYFKHFLIENQKSNDIVNKDLLSFYLLDSSLYYFEKVNLDTLKNIDTNSQVLLKYIQNLFALSKNNLELRNNIINQIKYNLSNNVSSYLGTMYGKYLEYFIIGYYTKYIPKINIYYNFLNDKNENLLLHNKTQFLLEIKNVSFKTINNDTLGYFSYNLYDTLSKSTLVDTTIQVNSESNGFEYTCEEGSLNCFYANFIRQTINGVISSIIHKGYDQILTLQLDSLKTIQLEKILLEKNNLAKINSIFNEANIISDSLGINTKNCFKTFFNKDSTKFLALYLNENLNKEKLFEKNTNQIRRVRNIETRYDISDSMYFEDIPPQYVGIYLSGEYFQNKWYFDSPNEELFYCEDLECAKLKYVKKMLLDRYFEKSSTSFNEYFWEEGFFSQITDETKSDEWEYIKDYDHVKKRVENEKKYIGITKFIAYQLMDDK